MQNSEQKKKLFRSPTLTELTSKNCSRITVKNQSIEFYAPSISSVRIESNLYCFFVFAIDFIVSFSLFMCYIRTGFTLSAIVKMVKM